MSFLKQLLSPFIEFDEQKNAQGKSSGPQPTVKPPAQTSPTPPAAKAGGAITQQTSAAPLPTRQGSQHVEHPLLSNSKNGVDVITETPKYSPTGTLTGPLPQHERYFEDLIEKANRTDPYFAGDDYKEFVDSKLNIDDISDESLKYKTAFGILQSSGVTKEKLLRTGEEYLNVIGRDLNLFQSAYSESLSNAVGARESELKKKVAHVQSLLQQVNQLNKEINTLTQDISLETDKLNMVRSSFILAGEKKQDEIVQELRKISRYF